MLVSLKTQKWGWRDVSEVKSTDCSFRGPEFKSEQKNKKKDLGCNIQLKFDAEYSPQCMYDKHIHIYKNES